MLAIIDEVTHDALMCAYSILRAAILRESRYAGYCGWRRSPLTEKRFVLKRFIDSDCAPYVIDLTVSTPGNTISWKCYAINRGEMPNSGVSEEFSLFLLNLYDMMMKAIIDVYKCNARTIEDELDIQIISYAVVKQ